VQTLPAARCFVHTPARPATQADASRLYADADGLIQFFPHPAAAGSILTLLFDCTTPEGATDLFAVDIEAREGASAPTDQARQRVVRTLAPLEGDLAALTSQEIAKQGFPPRPDRETAPAQYDRWQSLVTRPWQMVASPGVPHPDTFNGGTSGAILNSNWSGAVATTGQVTLVQADWNVPPVKYPYNAKPGVEPPAWEYLAYSAFWVGLDGFSANPDGSRDLIQCGTEQDVDANFGSYYAWVQYISNAPGKPPQDPSMFAFSVSPRDAISASAWVCDSSENENIHGGFGCFFIADVTQNLAYSGAIAVAPGATFSGNSAEWIMERPWLDGGDGPFNGFWPLSNFGSTQMTNPWANGPKTNGNTFSTSADAWMEEGPGGTILSQGLVGDSVVTFDWLAYH
jgi:hypothetical protein